MGDLAEENVKVEEKIIDKYLDDETREMLESVRSLDLSNIQNLAFEGGGSKGMAYVGALMVS